MNPKTRTVNLKIWYSKSTVTIDKDCYSKTFQTANSSWQVPYQKKILIWYTNLYEKSYYQHFWSGKTLQKPFIYTTSGLFIYMVHKMRWNMYHITKKSRYGTEINYVNDIKSTWWLHRVRLFMIKDKNCFFLWKFNFLQNLLLFNKYTHHIYFPLTYLP